MVNTIIIKNDDTSGNTPADNELVTGELAVNTADGKLFYGDNNGDAQEFSMSGESNQTLTTGNGLTGANSGSTGNITFAVGAGTGIDVSSDAVAVDVSDFMTNGANNRVLTATGTDAMNAEANMTFDGTDLTLGNDLNLHSDSSKIEFGANGEVYLTHSHNAGLIVSNQNTGDDNFTTLTLKSEQSVVENGEVISRLSFDADDSDGTDGSGPAASITAVAEADFTAGDNSTKLQFGLGESGTAISRTLFTMDHDGIFQFNHSSGGFTLDGNTITGIDDSGEFTDNDAHIMTSAGINDRFAQINADTTGNAGTATALETARTISGASFDGTANITLNNSNITNGAGYTTNTGDVTLSGAQTFTGAKTFQTDTKLLFRDSGLFINSSADGTLKISSDDELSLEADDNVHVRVKDTFVVRENTDDDIFMRVHPDNQTLELRHEDSSTNQFKILVEANGATTLSTADSDGTAGHMTLDVDGNITLDADGGTITFSDNGSSLGTITSSGYSGNAGTATTLATARNIGGVSFNGSANINLPGVNTSGNQDTTGNAATATALATARNIAGQSFDGTGNISIAPTDLTSVTATASEINVLDGFAGATADLTYAKDLRATGVTTTEFDKLDGLTASTSELNIMDGVTATTSELNIMDGVTASTSELNIMDGVTATTTELNIMDGVTSSTSELNLLDGKSFVDEDNMASNSATAIASQQSIKAYVDAEVAGAGGGASALNDLSDVTYSSGDLTISSLDKIISGAITHDSSGTITLDGTGGISLKEGGSNTTLIRPTDFNGKGTILKSSNVQYYFASTDSSTFSANSSNVGDANTNVRFLPFNTHATADAADEPEHCFQAPCNGHVVAVFASSNNNLVKPFDPGQGFLAWQCHLQILERDGQGGANIFGGSVGSGDSRVTGTNTSATEIDGINHTNGEYQECLFPVGGTDIFPLVKGNFYSFVLRFSKMNFDESLGTNGTTSKNQTLHLTYIISWDETTSGSTLGDWSGY